MSDPFLPPPQLEAELENSSERIAQVMADAPDWSSEFALEFAALVRRHVLVRSAIMYALVRASEATAALINAEGLDQIKLAQGAVRGLRSYVDALIAQMEEAEDEATSAFQGDDNDVYQ